MAVHHHIACSCLAVQVRSELCHIGQVAALAGGPGVPGPVESKKQGLVVSQHMELPALQQELEVAQGNHHRQELSVEGAIPCLCVCQLPAVEGELLPFPSKGPLLQGRPYMVVAHID